MSYDTPVGFDEFYHKEYVPLVAFAQRLGAGLHDAEDAVQDAFQDLAVAWHEVKQPAAWMRLTVRRKVYRTYRNRWRIRPLDGFETGAPAGGAEPDETPRVLGLLRLLPPRQRVVMAWRVDGYSLPEIARIEGISDKDVRKAFRQARARLTRLIEEN
jgi:RNA polymerase sigma-70 factor, ECF subfamily